MTATNETTNELKVNSPVELEFHRLSNSPTHPSKNITIGLAGLTKYHQDELRETSPLSKKANQRCFGSDVACFHQINNTSSTMFIHDGHGPQGHHTSFQSMLYFESKYIELITNISNKITSISSEELYDIIQPLYSDTSNYLNQELFKIPDYNKGGSTCSHLSLVSNNNRRYLLSSNMGDSPILIINNLTGQVQRFFSDHHWENTAEFQSYVDHCASKDVTPCLPMYGRWNCVKQAEIPDRNGNYKPIPIYDIRNNKVTVHDGNLSHITDLIKEWGYLGGIQTCRKMLLQDPHGNVIEPYPGFGHTNWGSSIITEIGGETVGLCRCTRGWGDWAEQTLAHTISDQPSLRMMEVPENHDITAIVMSDGIGDLWYFHKLGSFVQEKIMDNPSLTGSELSQLILLATIQLAKDNPEYTVKKGLPTWDNISLVVARWPSSISQTDSNDKLNESSKTLVKNSNEIVLDETHEETALVQSKIINDVTCENNSQIRDFVRKFIDDIINHVLESQSRNETTRAKTDDICLMDKPCHSDVFIEVNNSRPLTPPTLANLEPDIFCDNHYLLLEYSRCVDSSKQLADKILTYYQKKYTQIWIPDSYSQVEIILARLHLIDQQIPSDIVTWKDKTSCIYFKEVACPGTFKYAKLAEIPTTNKLIGPDHYETSEISDTFDTEIHNGNTSNNNSSDNDTSDNGPDDNDTSDNNILDNDQNPLMWYRNYDYTLCCIITSSDSSDGEDSYSNSSNIKSYYKSKTLYVCKSCDGVGLNNSTSNPCGECDGTGFRSNIEMYHNKPYDYSQVVNSNSNSINLTDDDEISGLSIISCNPPGKTFTPLQKASISEAGRLLFLSGFA